MDGIKKIMSYGRFVFLAVLVLIILGSTTIGKTYADGSTRRVELEKFGIIPLPELKANDLLNVEIQVTGGGAVDLLLIKASELDNYKNAAVQRGKIAFMNYIPEGSMLDAESKSYSYTIKDAGDYYLVIDNTNVPYKGALPLNAVDMNLKVATGPQTAKTTFAMPTSSETTTKSPGFEAIIGIIAIVVLIFIRK